MAEKKSVSMQDIADELGVSKVTVSKALNGKEGVGEALKKKSLIWQRNQDMFFPIMETGRRKKSELL